MDAGINNVIYMELHSGPKMANGTCRKTIVAGTIDRGSTVLLTKCESPCKIALFYLVACLSQSYPKCAHQVWGPPSLLFKGDLSHFPHR